MIKYIKEWIKYYLESKGYYQVDELQIGGHCGLCGKWIPDKIFPKYWAIGICKNHIK